MGMQGDCTLIHTCMPESPSKAYSFAIFVQVSLFDIIVVIIFHVNGKVIERNQKCHGIGSKLIIPI